MSKFSDRVRGALLRFLRLDQIGTLARLPDEQAMQHIARELLGVHRVFGDPSRLQVGRNVILNDALVNTTSGRVVLEDFAFCGHHVSLLTGTHDFRSTDYQRQSGVPQEGRDIHVGQGAWLGSNATVLGPCRIGRNAVVAAGAVVTGDVEADSIYAGVPARRVAPAGTAPPAGFQGNPHES
ncbi:MAG: DapH/DapD/GlmU-related protein [Ramlibacter sp.]